MEKLKALWGKLREAVKKLSKKVIIAAAAAVIIIAAAAAIYLNSRPYATLVTNVNTSEMASVLTLLESWGVRDYKVENGDTILVPQSQQASLQARVLMENVTQSGTYYSSRFDNIGALSTESERNQAILLDLQDYMGATIRCFDNVKDATVTLTPGEDRSYVLDSGNVVDAKASVFVTMVNGTKLTTEQAAGIRQLVANCLQGLEIDNVVVMDTTGNTYSGGDLTADADASKLKLLLEEEQENKIRTAVMQALSPYYGEDNIRVAVNCVVEVGNTTEDRIEYWLPEYAQDGSTGGRGIIGSLIYQWSYTRDGDETTGGVVGSSTNSQFPEYVEDLPELDGTESEASASGQKDYQTNSSKKNIVTTAGYLTDCTISVSINSSVAGNVNTDTVRQHAARAAGIAGTVDPETGVEYLADRISVMNEPFYTPPIVPSPEFEAPWILIAAAIGLVIFLILLAIILIILSKRRKKRKEEEEEHENEVNALLEAAGIVQPAPEGADVMEIQSERSMELRKDIRQFANDNPEIAAQMLRGWLRGGDENG